KSFGDLDVEVLGGYSVQSFRNWGYFGTAYGFNAGDGLDSMQDELESSFDAAESIANGIYGEGDYSQWGFSDDVRGNDTSGNPVPDGTTGFVNRINGESFETTYSARTAGIGVDAITAN
ncbi:MAG: SusC/RagA family TonB-linked outer membrane protein, partial [Bacteroidota bacterium]